jgi:hypothetical protein
MYSLHSEGMLTYIDAVVFESKQHPDPQGCIDDNHIDKHRKKVLEKPFYSVLNREKDDTDKNKPVREKSAANVAVFFGEDYHGFVESQS